MAWAPSNTELYVIDQLNEFVNFTNTISYDDQITYPDETWVVTIVPDQIISTVNISGGTISGYYSNTFDGYSIKYLTVDGKYVTASGWNSINNAKEIVDYQPAMQQSKTFTYTATAKSSISLAIVTQPYTIVVTNDWTVGKNNLQAAIAQTKTVGR
jgi:hypothetical protein